MKELIKRTALLGGLILGPLLVSGQNPFDAQLGGMSEAIDALMNLCYVLAAVCALIGGVQSYRKIVFEGESAFVAIGNWVYAGLALIVVPAAVKLFFGV